MGAFFRRQARLQHPAGPDISSLSHSVLLPAVEKPHRSPRPSLAANAALLGVFLLRSFHAAGLDRARQPAQPGSEAGALRTSEAKTMAAALASGNADAMRAAGVPAR